MRDACRVLVGKPEGKSHLEELGADGSIMLKWILKNRGGGIDGLMWPRVGKGGRLL